MRIFLFLALLGWAWADPPPYRSSIQSRPIDDDFEEEQRLSRLAKITLMQAGQAALKRHPGATISEVELENHEGNVVFEVELWSDGQKLVVIVDAGTGEVLYEKSESR
ncbi:MAG: PepSY domain-containing protein [Candidatus Eremiobacteraeota bacterium]|nr:PepSY domain-containing protein [Candidatus Eremiobacteraeota bacterium]MCW5872852.1 PepSY domain-containing protein [Candidatus Eremiobacteraeota bacterium]